MRFWPSGSGSSAQDSRSGDGDSVYYAQLTPPLLSALHKAHRTGRLGLLQPGSQLIARHEDRIVWIQISEKGNNFCYYVAKGMELQGRSKGTGEKVDSTVTSF